jgi:Na+/H+-dicarboxylate symporter
MSNNNGRLALHWQILIAMAIGAGCGALSGTEAGIGSLSFYAIYDFLGTLFMNALKMLIVPLIVSSLISGMAGFGPGNELGRIGVKTLGYYLLSSAIAILIGLFITNLIQPGIVDGKAAGELLHFDNSSTEVAGMLASVEQRGAGDFARLVLDMVPTNIVAAAVEGQMLGLITFSLLFGFFMTRIGGAEGDVVQRFWAGTFGVMMRITLLVMRFAPLGVFGLVAKTVAATGFAAFGPMLTFFITVVIALLIHFLVALPLLLWFVGRVHPYAHIKAMAPALLTAFSTASSSATLPVTMECLEKNSGVSNRVSGFVLPLGATVNMDGTALYECAAALFIAQAYGLDLTIGQQLAVVVTALLTSIGVAGIPAASLVAIGVILGVLGLPLEAIGVLLITDRVLDMMRTTVNIFSDSCGAVVIARSEGETTAIDR